MSPIKSVVIVGGTGKVTIELTRLLLARKPSPPQITSIIRSTTSSSFKSLESLPDYSKDRLKAVPLSLETATIREFANVFKEAKADVIVFGAGAGGKPGEDGTAVAGRTKKVDYEGALKVFDAIEEVHSQGLDPRLLLISGVDVRDINIIPEHYDDEDKAGSARFRSHIATWFHYKYLADKNLIDRTKFKWTILRPGVLNDKPATGLIEVGKTHVTQTVPRADVAHALELLIDRPDAAGLALDIVGGNTPMEVAVDRAINDRVTSWIG